MRSITNILARYLIIWLFTILCLTVDTVFAQSQQLVLKGVVFKSSGNVRLGNVLVADLNNNVIVTTDNLGIFDIKCAIGDTLLFRQKDYLDQKLPVTMLKTMMVFMQPVINLQEVNIKALPKSKSLTRL